MSSLKFFLALVISLQSLMSLPVMAALAEPPVQGTEPAVELSPTAEPTFTPASLPTVEATAGPPPELTIEPEPSEQAPLPVEIPPTATPAPATLEPTAALPTPEATLTPTALPTEVELSTPEATLTPTALPTEGVTVETGDIQTQIQAEGRPAGAQAGLMVGDGHALQAVSAAAGEVSLLAVPFGVYDLTAASPGFLSATCAGVVHQGRPTRLTGVTLLAGDLDNNGVIDMADATALGLALNQSGPGLPADLNGDGLVDVLDLILLSANYGQTSPAHPWLCQGTP